MNAAKSYEWLVRAKGFELRPRTSGMKNIGNVSGTAGHKAFTRFFENRRSSGEIDETLLYTTANENLAENIDGVEWDKTTPESAGISGAQFQLKRMLDAYLPTAMTIKPKHLELELITPLDTDFEFKGEMDIVEEDGTIRDMKFGKNVYPYEAQLGGYYLLLEKNGYEPNGRLIVDHTPRTAKTKPQKPTEVIEYNKDTAVVAADRTAEEIMRQITKFKETGDPWSFPANPNTFLCSKTWCPAHSTPFCDMGRPDYNKEED
jgi:hypothetical protein